MDMKTSAANLSQEIRVPFNKLRISPDNVRKPAPKGDKQRFKLSIESLAHSILIVGLLQNLVVTQAEDDIFDVEAGGRRYTALALLVKQGKIPETYEVRCLLVPKDNALIASLTENIEREQLHPVEELESWKKLVDGGTGIEDVAAIFHVTPDVVRRRLKLANVSPRLLKACREGEASIEQLMALSVTDNHKAQEQAFFNVQMEWQRAPKELRARLTEVRKARRELKHYIASPHYNRAEAQKRFEALREKSNQAQIVAQDMLLNAADKIPPEDRADVVQAISEDDTSN